MTKPIFPRLSAAFHSRDKPVTYYLTVFDLRVQQLNMTKNDMPDQGMGMGGIKL